MDAITTLKSRLANWGGCALVQADVAPKAAVLWLHGREMAPEDVVPLLQALRAPVLWCVPAGPVQHGQGRHSWWPPYDELGTPVDDFASHQPEGRAAALASLRPWWDIFGAPDQALPWMVAGFSQGGMLLAEALAHWPDAPRPDALAWMSSSRVAVADWPARVPLLADMPVLVAHGNHDVAPNPAAGEALCDWLTGQGAHCDWLPFDGGHELPLVVWRRLQRMANALKRSGVNFS